MIDFTFHNPVDVILFPEPVKVSCFTKKKGPLTKIIRLDPETKKLVKDSSKCSMSQGSSETILTNSPEGFGRLLRSLETNQAMAHGVSKYDKALVVTKSHAPVNISPDNPVIPRTKDFFFYHIGPGVLMVDHDKARDGSIGGEAALKAYRPQELVKIIATVYPGITAASYVSTPSTSACIYDANGNELRGEGTGSHTYFFAKKASDIPRFMDVLAKKLIMASFGRIEISGSGSSLLRTIFDMGVSSPERLDFVAGAVCESGLVQKLPDPTVHHGEMLDTTTLPDLTPEEEEAYKAIVEALRNEAKPSQDKVIAEYIERESSKLAAARNISLDDARQSIVSRQDHVLTDDDQLFFAHLKSEAVSVAEVLDNPETITVNHWPIR